VDLYAASVIVSPAEYARAAMSAALLGTPFNSLADWAAEVEAGKIVSLADMRKRLRPDAIAEV
jgi:hypothetical protein